ncbi:GntR family transcriptional regulator [Bordetella genomosp. 12]|uniref:GntR family transcriptional regulator n=1 Tax=Bordetella genomosp. 12 TaxID=463035 RepID=A0A261VAE4_9BORD|nr:GntR family transcriptional regulator [Bordetella genomosp. 12]OZI70945.1 GntR family transcriptional regulator [Bordetella genomosp. 12]
MAIELSARRMRPAPDQAASQQVAPRQSLGDEVYELLLSQLISLKISPGSRIAIDALARELGVSQTPIRAALIRLENEGMVLKIHNVGFSAAPMPSRERFVQIYDLRLLLEPYTAGKAAENLSDDSRAQLLEAAGLMNEPASKDVKLAYSKFALQDAQFHELIARQSGNELVKEALSRAYAHAQLFRLRFHSRVTEEAITEHANIVTAILAGDAKAASAAMEHHIEQSRGRMQPFFDDME